jgi:hypothetical protein
LGGSRVVTKGCQVSTEIRRREFIREPSDLVRPRLLSQLREARARIAPRPIGQRTFRRAATLTPASSEEEGEASSGDFEESEDLGVDAAEA